MGIAWRKWKDAALDLLYPPKCIFCRELTEREPICPKCAAVLPQTGDDALRELGGGLRCAAPFYYEGCVRESLLRFKFHDCGHYARGYAEQMARTAALELGDGFDIVSWTPVSRKRRQERGYDQAELLARELCRLWDTAPLRTLQKTVHTPAQSGIAEAEKRRANVLGVYEAVNGEQWTGKRILLVDDILTTGATLREAARTLTLAGAAEVTALTVAMARSDKAEKPDREDEPADTMLW